MIKDNFALTGALTIAINDKIVQETKNLVVTAGKDWVADRMNNANSVMTHMAVGTSSVSSGADAAAKARTTLGSELDRNAFTTATAVSGTAITYVCLWDDGDGTGAITEAGIFNAGTGGDMLARTVFPVVNKGDDDSMTITWTITIT